MAKEKKLEQLLNKLVELWRKPRGWEAYIWHNLGDTMIIVNVDKETKYYSINDLCSIDSELRQFVCEKWLYKEQNIEDYNIYIWSSPLTNHSQERYRLMLSAIQNDKEQFLLKNIVLSDWERKC